MEPLRSVFRAAPPGPALGPAGAGRVLARSRPVRLIPGRPAHLGAGWLAQVDPAGGPVRVVVRG
jgi:hypothetical protein